ncbi:MAG: ParB/RepB/Spo0J family partition protein [Phycisphaeraceae bacterium]|nr:ParB/RepB/Spo0J family partition protein [Phycisphaeraceae bacterium]
MATKKNRPSRLGRGLSSLMATPVEVVPPQQAESGKPTVPAASPSGDPSPAPSQPDGAGDQGLVHLTVSSIKPNQHQPRQRFDPAKIRSLAESIKNDGLMQPIVVRPAAAGPGQYELVAGERRWRAAQEAGLDRVPALVREIDEEKAAELALIENLQREDLNAIEKAEAFQHLGDQFGLTHTQIAERVGLERSSVSNLLRLLDLSDFVRDLVREKVLSMGQARAIAGLADAVQQRALAERAVREGLSVRQVEQEARRLQQPAAGRTPSGSSPSPVLSDLEKQIGQQLGTRVKIRAGKKKGAGTIAIDFYSLDEFDTLLARLDVKAD